MPTKKLQMLGYKIVPPEHIGLSAFEIAKENGFEGTEAEWLEHLATLKIHTTSNLNTATAPGLYQVTGSSTLNLPHPYHVPDGQMMPNDFGYGTVIVENNGDRVYQTICNNNISAKRFYKPITQTWGEWEYENPPYISDIEYRTTDRIDGMVVYKRITSDGILEYRLDGESEDAWRTYQDSLGITQESLGISQESLGINLESIGAAPAGYGIGKLENYSCASDADVDRILDEQIADMEDQSFKRFVLSFTTTTNFTGGGGHYYVDIYRMEPTYATITVKSYIAGGRTLQRVWTKESNETSATLKPWEWENPPLKVGVEYRTTERFLGEPVYAKLIDFGSLPSNGGSSYSYVADYLCDIVRVDGFWYYGTSKAVKKPFVSADFINTLWFASITEDDKTTWNLYVDANADGSSYYGLPAIYYTKREV
jgi:hypothetical protein